MKVVGYGDNVVDRYINKNKMFPGGNCVNFAVYAHQLGMESAYLGTFGKDVEAERVQKSLNDMGIDISKCKVEEGSVTERCDVIIEDSGNRVFVQYDERNNLHDIRVLGEKDLDYLKGFDLIHCSCYAEEESEIPKLKDMPGICAFDFSEEEEYRTKEYLNHICPYINFALFSCEEMKLEKIKELLMKVRKKGVKYVLATMGMKGQILYDGEKFYHGKAKHIEVLDTMGAGDSFFTAFMIYLLKSGWTKTRSASEESIKEAFAFAAEFAANNCLVEGSFGCSAISGKEANV